MSIRLPVVEGYLREQRDLSVVGAFARQHEAGLIEGKNGLYEAQIPLSKPNPGEAYGFVVDLDACTGCKACVVGCNKMNGLDEDEAWRSVGTLEGSGPLGPIQQTVTAACHHCAEPGCMKGCPVGAYEKDAVTGIVKHLDDQCIGCQYCTLTCPYEVPQYNTRLGIVRKCDMCTDRLAAAEAPACVQACPNGAITIGIVELASVKARAAAGVFLPEAPEPQTTLPTTIYKTKGGDGRALEPTNLRDLSPAPAHSPLVVMLVLTQLSVGGFALSSLALLGAFGDRVDVRWLALASLLTGLLGLGAALLHLGRPQYAFRAFIGLRTSWMSREIVVFGAFAMLAKLATFLLWLPDLLHTGLAPRGLLEPLLPLLPLGATLATLGVAVIGLASVACSAMIYVVTARPWWSASRTFARFFGTVGLLGAVTAASTLGLSAAPGAEGASAARNLLIVTLVLGALKLGLELADLRLRFGNGFAPTKRSALLLVGALRAIFAFRLVSLVAGGLLLPCVLLVLPFDGATFMALASVALVLCFSSELAERVTYFRASSPKRMPGFSRLSEGHT